MEGLLPPSFVGSQGIGSLLAMPLVAHQELIGMLVGDRGAEPLRLSADELELAMIFANQASVWIASARLFVQEQAAQRKFRELLELAPDAILTALLAGIAVVLAIFVTIAVFMLSLSEPALRIPLMAART